MVTSHFNSRFLLLCRPMARYNPDSVRSRIFGEHAAWDRFRGCFEQCERV